MPWFSPLFKETIEIEDGNIKVPDRSGIGFSFDQSAIAHFKIC
jgi:L-alanine-DL-glutamate epimerase-like enolase superfamily enzyme